jgi:hypothetical protein
MKKRLLVLPLLLLAHCASPEQTYCDGFGLGTENPEYQKCLSYYFQQEAAFRADRQVCEFEADKTYPRTLYDNGRWERVHGGFGYGHYGYGGGATVFVEPDYYHNREVDGLRMRIIEPCMQARGWNSGASWQAGRRTGSAPKSAAKPAPQPIGQLPWLK